MSHSLRVISSITKVTSPGLRRHATKLTSAARQFSAPPSASKPTDKKPSSSKAVKEESRVIEKGDSYKAGETYFSFSSYSFYDFEQEMQKHRAPQPTANPKEKYYCNEGDKRESMTELEHRRLLPDPWGYLMEWPQEAEVRVVKAEINKKETKAKRDSNKEYYPIVETPYKVQRDPKTDPYYKARIPL